MRHIVPQRDGGQVKAVVFMTQNAERRGTEQEMLRCEHGRFDPSDGQHPPKMPVREEGDVAVPRAKTGDEPIAAGGYLGGRFATRTAVAEDIPIRVPLENLRSSYSFEVTVVPLCQVRINLGDGSEPCKFTGLARPLTRAGEHGVEVDAAKTIEQPVRIPFAFLGQWYLRSPGMPAR